MKFVLFSLALFGLVLLLPGCGKIAQTRANAHFDAGVAKHRDGDIEGAIADYSRAIAVDADHIPARGNRSMALVKTGALDLALEDADRVLKLKPTHAGTYRMRSSIRQKLGDLKGALADADQAVVLEPDVPASYMMRGTVKVYLEDARGGLKDLDHAVELDPESPTTYASRGSVRHAAGDPDGALADFNKAIDLDPGFDQAYRQRGTAMIHRQEWARAVADLQESLRLAKPEADVDYSHFFLWIARARAGQGKAAHEGLADYFEARTDQANDDWTPTVASFLLDRIPEDEFLAAATSAEPHTDRNQKCEAWYYAGVKRLLAGNESGAREAFENCTATKQIAFYEYQFARSALKHMSK